jgi:hypothetical protein
MRFGDAVRSSRSTRRWVLAVTSLASLLVLERPGRYYALGDHGQYVYVAPDGDAVVVRLGRKWRVDNRSWVTTLRSVADQLASGS